MHFKLTIAFLSLILATGTNAMSCLNAAGRAVDWWYVEKLPTQSGHSQATISAGTAFLYQDASTPGNWLLSNYGIDTTQNAVYQTMQQIYSGIAAGNQSFYYGMYNDETPSGTETEAKAHAKGVQAFDSQQGFWILHSVPKFPGEKSYSYPSSGTKYGQSMLCVSFNTAANLDNIGVVMQYYYPEVYAVQMPAAFVTAYPNLNSAMVHNGHIGSAPYTHTVTLTSTGGVSFTSFSKTRDWGKDLYSDLVTPSLQSSFYVETWQDGGGDLPSVCNSTYKTWSLHRIYPGQVVNFTTTDDHSKWAVSSVQQAPWICVGGINRQSSQFKRGGGTLCQSNVIVWNTYYSAVIDYIQCDGSVSAPQMTEFENPKPGFFTRMKLKFCKHVYDFCS